MHIASRTTRFAKYSLWLVFLIQVAFPCTDSFAQETPLTAGQTVAVHIFGIPADEAAIVSISYQIGDSGDIRFPYIKPVHAAGLKPSELARKIEEAYKAADIFSRPTVNVMTEEGAMRQVTLGGNVVSQGMIRYHDGMSLYVAILTAGGYNEFAKKEAKILRDGNIFEYRMKEIEKDPRKDPLLRPGDIVTVR